jgi:2-oxoglutarate dehydrogenase E1 component
LRRQIRRNFRKPLIVMTPKSLLRHKRCVSRLEEFGPGTTFHRVLPDDAEGTSALLADDGIKRVVLCSGKVYYDLLEAREKMGVNDVYLMRQEQLYPFPPKTLGEQLKRFPQAELVWCQEEPKNMGAWSFVNPRLEEVMETVGMRAGRPVYVGRPEAASPATGLARNHLREQEALVTKALTVEPAAAQARPVSRKAG